MLVDANDAPFSLVVTSVNRRNVPLLKAVPEVIVDQRACPPHRRYKPLCADARYTAAPALKVIHEHRYIPHVKGRGQKANELKRDRKRRAKRWVVEVAHSGSNRFRKLLVQCEKVDQSFLARKHLAASIITFRKIRLDVNIIHG